MTDETVDCFNCGRANPEWAQVCRSCGVVLRHGQARIVRQGRVPTDRDSIVSIAAVIGTILLAVFLGLLVSNIAPAGEPVGAATPTPSPSPTEEQSVAPSESASVAPAPSPTEPPLPGSVVFGTMLDGNRMVTDPQETFTPGMTFAHSITHNAPFGAATIGEEVVRVNEDGTEGETLVAAPQNQLGVDPAASAAGFVASDSGNFVRSWGTGLYEMRVYIGETLIARGQFRLAEG